MTSRPSVLVIAEAANPDWVSVPLVGWSLANALRNVADVHLVTQIRNREAILASGLVEGRDFTVIDTEPLARPMYRLASVLRMGRGKGWTMTTAISGLVYPYFERLVWGALGADIRAGRFDLVHRITPLTLTAVSPIAIRCRSAGVPFLLGPLNGGVPWPEGFDAERRREREWLSYVRALYQFKPGWARMLDASSAIFVGSQHTASEIPAHLRHKTVYLPENAIDPALFSRRSDQDLSGPIRACYIGRLVPYKGPDMLLEAAADLLRSGRMTLDILGDGPLRGALEAQIVSDGLSDAVTMHGYVDHAKVQDIAAGCNLLTFPSIREFGGGVVLEAMALGLVPVIVDYAGPGELVTPETGYKIPIGPRKRLVANLARQLAAIVDQPDVLPVIASQARDRALQYFTWSVKAQQVAEVYAWVLAGASGQPPDPLASGFLVSRQDGKC